MAKKKQKKNSDGGQQFLSDKEFVRQRVQALQIGDCYISGSIEKNGEGFVVVSRRHTGGRVSYACYLVDTWCCGVKDSFYRLRHEDYEFEEFIERIKGIPCSYDEAHNWVYGAIAYADEAGIKPEKSFALTKYFLQEDTDDVPLIEFEFGKDGKHCLVAHSRLEASQYLPLLKKNLGEDGFNYILPGEMAGDDLLDEDADSEDAEQLIESGNQPTMDVLLRKMRKEQLLLLGVHLWLSLDSGHDVSRLRREYRQQVLNDPKHVLMLLSHEDASILRAYKDVMSKHNAVNVGVKTPGSRHQTLLEVFGLAYRRLENDGEYYIYVAADFAEKVLPVLDEVTGGKEYKQLRYMECFIEGLANLYGEVSVEFVKQQLKQHFPLESDDDVQMVLDGTYDHSLALKITYYTTFGKVKSDENVHLDKLIFFMSRYGWLDYKREHDILSHIDIPHRMFSKEEIIDAGLPGYISVPNAAQQDFYAFLKQIGHEKDAREICFDLWFFAAHEGDRQLGNKSYKTYFEDVVLDQSEQELAQQGITRSEAMQRMEEYMSHSPRWMLRGHSPADMELKERRVM